MPREEKTKIINTYERMKSYEALCAIPTDDDPFFNPPYPSSEQTNYILTIFAEIAQEKEKRTTTTLSFDEHSFTYLTLEQINTIMLRIPPQIKKITLSSLRHINVIQLPVFLRQLPPNIQELELPYNQIEDRAFNSLFFNKNALSCLITLHFHFSSESKYHPEEQTYFTALANRHRWKGIKHIDEELCKQSIIGNSDLSLIVLLYLVDEKIVSYTKKKQKPNELKVRASDLIKCVETLTEELTQREIKAANQIGKPLQKSIAGCVKAIKKKQNQRDNDTQQDIDVLELLEKTLTTIDDKRKNNVHHYLISNFFIEGLGWPSHSDILRANFLTSLLILVLFIISLTSTVAGLIKCFGLSLYTPLNIAYLSTGIAIFAILLLHHLYDKTTLAYTLLQVRDNMKSISEAPSSSFKPRPPDPVRTPCEPEAASDQEQKRSLSI